MTEPASPQPDTPFRVEPADATDYPSILALNESAIPAVNRIDEGDLTALHEQAETLLVVRPVDAEAGVIIAGFMLVLNERAEYSSVNYQYFRSRYPRFAYVDRIVVNPDFRRSGVGRLLYQALVARTSDMPRITCEVNVRPANPGSLAFHEELGFKVVDEQNTEGGSKRVALMVREREGF